MGLLAFMTYMPLATFLGCPAPTAPSQNSCTRSNAASTCRVRVVFVAGVVIAAQSRTASQAGPLAVKAMSAGVVGFRLSHSVGVGGLVRYLRASLSLPLTDSASDVSIGAGGMQVGGGVRFYF